MSWSLSTRPDAELVNTMLDSAVETLNAGERPVIPFSDLWWDPEGLLQVSYKNMYIVAANELLQKMQNS